MLTDEQIRELAREYETGRLNEYTFTVFSSVDLIAFARAIIAATQSQPSAREQRLSKAMERFDAEGPLPGMISAFETQMGVSWTDQEWRQETALWAAAWRLAATQAQASPDLEAQVAECKRLADQFANAAVDMNLSFYPDEVRKHEIARAALFAAIEALGGK